MLNWQLKNEPYGLSYKNYKNGSKDLVRNVNELFSIFEDPCFTFYLCKYCEVLGFETLLAA